MADQEMLFHLELLFMILIKGSLYNNYSLVVTPPNAGNIFLLTKFRNGCKMTPYISDCLFFHKTLSVIHDIRVCRGHRIHF